MSKKKPRKAQSRIERPEDDFYLTPRDAVIALANEVVFHSPIWDPCCGSGTITKTLLEFGYKVTATNLLDHGYEAGTAGVDFLESERLLAPTIICNPPFYLFQEFVLHALRLEARLAAFLIPTRYLEGRVRYRDIYRQHPPAEVLQFIERLKFYSGLTPLDEQPGWNNEAFAWLVWRRRYGGPTIVRWISARDDE